MHCAHCGTPTQLVGKSARCPGCEAMFVSLDLLPPKLGPALARGAKGASARACMSCGAAMRRARLGPVEVDDCVTCRFVFFDTNELDAVRAQLGLPAASSPRNAPRPPPAPTPVAPAPVVTSKTTSSSSFSIDGVGGLADLGLSALFGLISILLDD